MKQIKEILDKKQKVNKKFKQKFVENARALNEALADFVENRFLDYEENNMSYFMQIVNLKTELDDFEASEEQENDLMQLKNMLKVAIEYN